MTHILACEPWQCHCSSSTHYLGGQPEAQRVHPRPPLQCLSLPHHLPTTSRPHVCLLSPSRLEPPQGNPQNGRKYFQVIYLIRDFHIEFMKNSFFSRDIYLFIFGCVGSSLLPHQGSPMKNSYNLIIKRQTIHYKNIKRI